MFHLLIFRIVRNILSKTEKQKVTLILFAKFTWRICCGSITTGGLGRTFKLWGNPSRMWYRKELFWCLAKFQDLGQHGYFLIRILDALGKNTNSAVNH